MYIKIEKPKLATLERNIFFRNKIQLFTNNKELNSLIDKYVNDEYLYWDKLKYKINNLPKGITKEEFWYWLSEVRKISSKNSPIQTLDKKKFRLNNLNYFQKLLHQIDLNTGGKFLGLDEKIDEKKKYQFMHRGLMEEAIATSQLEGANTTTKVAKEFLRTGRKAKNKSEHMILNTYETMKAIENDYKDKKLSLEILFELHDMITKNTIEEDRIGKFRKNEDKIVVQDALTGEIAFETPPIEFVKQEMSKLILFANDELETEFIHPIIKAIMLHFWIGYLHPFFDGNGRLARILFYWYLLRNNYWAFAYLPISAIIKKSPKQYSMSYMYTEQDDNDLTYFLDYNMRKIKQAIREFEEYIQRQFKDNLKLSKNLKINFQLNDRQIQLLKYLNEDENKYTTLKTYININQISNKTAIKDLKELEKKEFLISKKIGRNIYYYGSSKIEKYCD